MTTDTQFTAPAYRADAFTCPFCKTFAQQHWGNPSRIVNVKFNNQNINHGADNNFSISYCGSCKKFTVWVNEKLIYPRTITAPPCSPDLPEDIRPEYEEAQLILNDSSRGAAALLRLAIQKLCVHLGETGKNINQDIASLVKKGLPSQIQKALDIVRVVGNNAVHPGQIDLKDDVEITNSLFGLINLIVDVMITQPKHVENMYESVVPENLRNAIEKRDNS